MNDDKYDWLDVENTGIWLFFKKEFLKYFIVSVVLVVCTSLIDGEIESDKLWTLPFTIVVITGCLYIAHICINIILKSIRIK